MTKTNSVVQEKEEVVAEATTSADTLHPGAGSGGTMKMETINMAIAAIAGMSPEDLSKFYNETLQKFGKYSEGVPKDGASNQATLNMKPSAAVGGATQGQMPMPKLAKEDLEVIFGSDALTEEFTVKATTLFESAVAARVAIEKVALDEAYETKLTEEVTAIKTKLEEQIDQYLNYSVKEWIKLNEVAIESSIRNDVMESFISGLKNLFTEHYIEIPEDKVDLVAELASKVEDLEAKLNETVKEKMAVQEEVDALQKKEAFKEVSEGLAMTQVEKLRQLTESFNGEDLDSYKKKLSIVKESHFSTQKKPTQSNILTEEFIAEEDENNKIVNVDPSVARYAEIISRTVKK
jgi:hypothetical protein